MFITKRLLSILVLGVSSGLPLALVSGTLQAWLSDSGMTIEQIGYFTLLTLPYSFKFIWSPIVDAFVPKGFREFGRRKGWILISQALLAFTLLALSFLSPAQSMMTFFVVAIILALASATQDIVVDAFRAESLQVDEIGRGSSFAILGYRIGMLLSGAMALGLAEVYQWPVVYGLMAGLQSIIAVVVLTTLKEDLSRSVAPPSLSASIVGPFKEFFSRKSAILILVFITLFKLTDVMAGMFTTKFLLDLGYAKGEIAGVVKGLGLFATLAGSVLGGWWVDRLTMRSALIISTIIQGLSNVVFVWLASVQTSILALSVAVVVENISGGVGSAAFAAYLAGLCARSFTATQYSLLSGLASLPRSVLGVPCAKLVEKTSWEAYFIICTIAALPALLMIVLKGKIVQIVVGDSRQSV